MLQWHLTLDETKEARILICARIGARLMRRPTGRNGASFGPHDLIWRGRLCRRAPNRQTRLVLGRKAPASLGPSIDSSELTVSQPWQASLLHHRHAFLMRRRFPAVPSNWCCSLVCKAGSVGHQVLRSSNGPCFKFQESRTLRGNIQSLIEVSSCLFRDSSA